MDEKGELGMLDGVCPVPLMDEGEYVKKMDALEKTLAVLQLRVKEHGIPVVILFDGWSAAGKGTLISKALWGLDPRLFKMHSMEKTHEDQLMRPFLWRYGVGMPKRGEIAIFDRSYCCALMPDSGMLRHFDKMDRQGMCDDIRAFEAQLIDDGFLVLKFFLHVDKGEQTRRLAAILANEDTKWRVTEKDLNQNKEYDKYHALFGEILDKTGTPEAPWTVLCANDRRCTAVTFLENITARMKSAVDAAAKDGKLKSKPAPTPTLKAAALAPNTPPDMAPDILKNVDLTKSIPKDRYERRLIQQQQRLTTLGYKLYRERRSVVALFEGWDASGKGGAIKRLTQELDPRGYNVFPVAAPTPDEHAHHYLWRFWRVIPKDGHLTIFDRSWYGRVLVERLENLCSEDAWRRAYREINDLELHLHRHGVIILKFWLHIDADEQLSRFAARQSNPLKQHKISDEDWRNRDKWDAYYAAANDMLHKTSTPHAPWLIIEGNSKRHARVTVLDHVIDALERDLRSKD